MRRIVLSIFITCVAVSGLCISMACVKSVSAQTDAEIFYSVIFTDADGELDVQKIKAGERALFVAPRIPEGYSFAGWTHEENFYDFSRPVYSDKTLEARYVPEDYDYYIYFYADGNLIASMSGKDIPQMTALPEIPRKNGYSAEWKSFYFDEDEHILYVCAEYSEIVYTATFVADGKTVDRRSFTVSDDFIPEPSVPPKKGYAGKWENYSLTCEDMIICAEYTLIIYTAEFVADGVTAGIVEYSVEAPLGELPPVPEKEGYIGRWSDFTPFESEYAVVTAVYEIDPGYCESGSDGQSSPLTYAPVDGGWAVTGRADDSTEIIVPAEHDGLPVTEIAEAAFTQTDITSIKFGANVVKINDYAFYGCPLKSAVFGGKEKYIGKYAFSCCLFDELTLPQSLENIDNQAFWGCSALKRVSFGENVKYIGKRAFFGCGLESAYFAKTDEWFGSDGKSYSADFSSPEKAAYILVGAKICFSQGNPSTTCAFFRKFALMPLISRINCRKIYAET